MKSLHERLCATGGIINTLDGVPYVEHCGHPEAEYAALHDAVGVYPRSFQGLLEVVGADRAAWLHNLVTNEVRNLQPGEGNYAFALNVKGRVLFDGCALVAEDRVLLDTDRRWTDAALAHLQRYIIMEDVQLQDLTADHARLAVIGPGCAALCETLGVPNMSAMAQFQHQPLVVGDIPARLLRHDFCGPPAIELLAHHEHALALWSTILEYGQRDRIRAVGHRAVEAARIEAGVPLALADIDEEVIPAETRQLERAVSFNKGCYLGQEVVERMRAHRAVARLLIGLRFDHSQVCAGARLVHDGQQVGRVTSAIDSPALNERIGLGYVRTALASPGQTLTVHDADDSDAGSGTVTDLPFPGTPQPNR